MTASRDVKYRQRRRSIRLPIAGRPDRDFRHFPGHADFRRAAPPIRLADRSFERHDDAVAWFIAREYSRRFGDATDSGPTPGRLGRHRYSRSSRSRASGGRRSAGGAGRGQARVERRASSAASSAASAGGRKRRSDTAAWRLCQCCESAQWRSAPASIHDEQGFSCVRSVCVSEIEDVHQVVLRGRVTPAVGSSFRSSIGAD